MYKSIQDWPPVGILLMACYHYVCMEYFTEKSSLPVTNITGCSCGNLLLRQSFLKKKCAEHRFKRSGMPDHFSTHTNPCYIRTQYANYNSIRFNKHYVHFSGIQGYWMSLDSKGGRTRGQNVLRPRSILLCFRTKRGCDNCIFYFILFYSKHVPCTTEHLRGHGEIKI